MPTADQYEKLADRACRVAGAVHSPAAGAASRVICPVGVRLARELLANRNIQEAVRTTIPGRRVLLNQIRTYAERKGISAALPIIQKLAPAGPANPAPGVPVAPSSREADRKIQGMTQHIVHSMPTFFNAIDRFGEFLKDPGNPRRRRGQRGGFQGFITEDNI